MAPQSDGENLVRRPAPEVSTVERRDVQSMLELDPETLDPSYTYRFVKDEPLNVSRKRMKGYRPVSKEDQEKTLVEADDQGDGLIRVGDTILMRCPKKARRERARDARELAESRLRIPKQKVKDMAKKNRVKTIEDEEGT